MMILQLIYDTTTNLDVMFTRTKLLLDDQETLGG